MNQPPRYADEVRRSIVSSYYPRLTSSPDSLRGRAHAAYAIASTVAGGIIGASLLANLSTVSSTVKTLGLAAVFGWFIAAGVYVSAVSSSVPYVESQAIADPDRFVDEILKRTREEGQLVRKRLRVANSLSIAAGLLTFVTLASYLFVDENQSGVEFRVVVVDQQEQTLLGLCGKAGGLQGKVASPEANIDGFLRILPTPSSCPDAEVLLLPRDSIVALYQIR
jgi:MFS family permease